MFALGRDEPGVGVSRQMLRDALLDETQQRIPRHGVDLYRLAPKGLRPRVGGLRRTRRQLVLVDLSLGDGHPLEVDLDAEVVAQRGHGRGVDGDPARVVIAEVIDEDVLALVLLLTEYLGRVVQTGQRREATEGEHLHPPGVGCFEQDGGDRVLLGPDLHVNGPLLPEIEPVGADALFEEGSRPHVAWVPVIPAGRSGEH